METKEFGEYFAEVRKREGFTSQRELAEKSGVSNATISRLESGATKPTPEILRELSNCFVTVTYEELMQHAGYLDLESVINDYHEEYDHSGKLDNRYIEAIKLLRFSKIYVRGKGFLHFFNKRNINLQGVAANFKITLPKLNGILKGIDDIDIESAIRMSRLYRFRFSEMFVAKSVPSGGLVHEEILYRIDEIIQEDIERSRGITVVNKKKQEDITMELLEMNESRNLVFSNVTEDEFDFLCEQLKLYRELKLRPTNYKR